MTTNRATFTLDTEAHAFLMAFGGDNKSAFINDLLKREKQRTLAEELMKANQEEAEDQDYQEDLSHWDVTLSDGLSTDV